MSNKWRSRRLTVRLFEGERPERAMQPQRRFLGSAAVLVDELDRKVLDALGPTGVRFTLRDEVQFLAPLPLS